MLRKLALTIAVLAGTIGQTAQAQSNDWLTKAFLCIHKYEAPWQAHTGNGYYGGLQMDYTFMSVYGKWELNHIGTADHWSPATQIKIAKRAYYGYGRYGPRGFTPWPNTARRCGLL